MNQPNSALQVCIQSILIYWSSIIIINRKGHFCIYCNQIYKESDADDKEEPWIGCDSCHRWVHQNCERQNGFEIKPNGYLCPCCRNQPSNGSVPSNIPAAALTAAANKHYEPILMKPGAWSSNSKENKKRRRKPTLETNSKKVKQEMKQQLTIDINNSKSNSNQTLSSQNTSNRLCTPTSALSLSPSTTLGLPKAPQPSTSTCYFDNPKQLYDVDSYYKENESQCISPSTNSKLSMSSDDEYSYESNTEEEEEDEYESDNSPQASFICGEDFIDNQQEFIIWDPLKDKKSSVGVSFEQVENLINKNFGYSTLFTRKIQSLSAICAYELSNFDN